MDKKLQRILERCHELMDKGHSLEYCLKRFSGYEDQIRDHFSLAGNLEKLKKLEPPEHFRQNSLDHIITRAERQNAPVTARPYAPPASRRRAVLRPVFVFVILIVLSLFTFGGTLFASQDSLPGETLYPLKRSFEEFRLAVYPENLKGGLHLRFLHNRIDEAGILLDMDDEIEPGIIEELILEMDRQYDACRRYRCVDQETGKELMQSIETVKLRYRNRFGQDPANSTGPQQGQGMQGDGHNRGNRDQENNSKSNGRGNSK